MPTLTYRGTTFLKEDAHKHGDAHVTDKVYRGAHYFKVRKPTKVEHEIVYRGVRDSD